MTRKIILVAIVSAMLTLSSCGDDIDFSGEINKVTDRLDENRSEAEKLRDQGFISDTSYTVIYKNIETTKNKVNTVFNDNKNSLKTEEDVINLLNSNNINIYDAISGIRILGGKSSNTFDVVPSEDKVYSTDLIHSSLSNFIAAKITKIPKENACNYIKNKNWVVRNKEVNSVAKPTLIPSADGFKVDTSIPLVSIGSPLGSNVSVDHNAYSEYLDSEYIELNTSDAKICGRDVATDENFSKSVKPIEITPSSVIDDIRAKLEYPIYVLDNKTVNVMSLDVLSSHLKDAFNEGSYSNLNSYFVPAKNGNKPITLKSILESEGEYAWDALISNTTWNEDGVNDMGKDLLLEQFKIQTIALRLQEFDPVQIVNLNRITGLFNYDNGYGKYKIVDDKIYLLEYPVSAIKDFVLNSENKVVLNTQESGLGVNVITGSIIKYDYNSDNGTYLSSGVYIKDDGSYLTSNLGDTNGDNSSFYVAGTSKVKLGLPYLLDKTGQSLIAEDYEVPTIRVVLRDYLEATYAPEYNTTYKSENSTSTDESNLVVFGRKIRFNFKSEFMDNTGSINNIGRGSIIAYYIDKDGNRLEHSGQLKITHFCDAFDLMTKSEVTSISNEDKLIIKEADGITDSKLPDITELKSTKLYYNVGNSSARHSIKPTLLFPSNHIGKEDYLKELSGGNKESKRQRFWVIAVNTGIFSSGLYSDWIDSDSDTASLTWWNEYLEVNNFKYRVEKSNLDNYLLQCYRTQLQKEGLVIVDLETIGKIQQIYDKEEKQGRVKTIRTTFMVLGWILMTFSLVLMLVWILDTSVDIGASLLERITFGHWVAIKYRSDIPSNTSGDKLYLTGGQMLMRCLIIIAIGILLVRINIFDLVYILIDVFGGIAEVIERVIKRG